MKKTQKNKENTRAALAENQKRTMDLLDQTHAAMLSLAEERAANKLSNCRVIGVARELEDLKKVMAVYES